MACARFQHPYFFFRNIKNINMAHFNLNMKKYAVFVALAANYSGSKRASFLKVVRFFVSKGRNRLEASGNDISSMAKRKIK